MGIKFPVASHTDYIGFGSTYVAIVGETSDGTTFIPEAIECGATSIVIESGVRLNKEIFNLCKLKNIKITRVENARKALATLSAEAYDYPAKKLKIIGVTGTDGKTTSVYLLFNILKKAGKRVALLSGVENILDDQVTAASLTTPKPDCLHYFFDQCVKKKIEYVVMELSAQAISLHRIDGIAFDGLIFTNLSHEHGEWYSSLEDYFEVKCAILAQKKEKAPLVVNADSQWLRKIQKKFPNSVTAGCKILADYQAVSLQQTFGRQLLEMKVDNHWHQVETPLVGSYNVSNIIGAVGLMHQLDICIEDIITGIQICHGAFGRMQRYRLPNNAWAVIDYAHTPHAYASILPTLKQYARNLIVIFGAGGGKDIEKRSKMGKIAALYADRIILTNDNPRNDDPEQIMEDIVSDLDIDELAKVRRESNRVQAIQYAYEHSQTGDIIAILGKGHEKIQIIGSKRYHHSDMERVQSLFQ